MMGMLRVMMARAAVVAVLGLAVFCSVAMAAPQMDSIAKQVLLLDAATSTVLYEKDADELMTPSSMSKLMTLYVVFDRLKSGALSMDDTLPVSEKAWRMTGSKMFIEVGKRIAVRDLIYGVAVQSRNDACVTLAEGISGSEEDFAEEMNRVASRIGLTHSHFKNASGWPDPEHKVTARDLSRLALRLQQDFPEFYEIFSTPEFTYNKITQHNRNPLLGGDLGVDGMKTGHTEEAGYGIVLSAKQDERRLILVLNGLESISARAKEGERLLRYGFREFENRTPFRKGDTVSEADVWMGTESKVPLVVSEDVALLLPRRNKDSIRLSVEYNGPVAAPIKEGDPVGVLRIEMLDAEARMVPLFAGKTVGALSGTDRIWPVIKYFITRRGAEEHS